MMSVTMSIILIALCVAYTTALPGVLLFLRGISLLSDAISHAVLLGIAVMFLFVQSLTSIWLFVGATLAGVLTVVVTESIMQSNQLKQDAAIGVVFPCFFSIGIVLISLYARNVHLDIDMVALGEIAFAPFYRLHIYGYDIGPHAIWTMGVIGVINTICIFVLRKELMSILFDAPFAAIIGFRPRLVYYMMMILTSITAVGSFEIVGSIVVVALMITPAATAYLMVHRFRSLLMLAPILGMLSAISGYAIARVADVSIAGSIAAASGCIFVIVVLLSPESGIVARLYYRWQYRKRVARYMLSDYLRMQHHKKATYHKIARDLNWRIAFVRSVAQDGAAHNVYRLRDDTVMIDT